MNRDVVAESRGGVEGGSGEEGGREEGESQRAQRTLGQGERTVRRKGAQGRTSGDLHRDPDRGGHSDSVQGCEKAREETSFCILRPTWRQHYRSENAPARPKTGTR